MGRIQEFENDLVRNVTVDEMANTSAFPNHILKFHSSSLLGLFTITL
jgi:hypothetical protein